MFINVLESLMWQDEPSTVGKFLNNLQDFSNLNNNFVYANFSKNAHNFLTCDNFYLIIWAKILRIEGFSIEHTNIIIPFGFQNRKNFDTSNFYTNNSDNAITYSALRLLIKLKYSLMTNAMNLTNCYKILQFCFEDFTLSIKNYQLNITINDSILTTQLTRIITQNYYMPVPAGTEYILNGDTYKS